MHAQTSDFWNTYVGLTDVHSENQFLKDEIAILRKEIADLSERAASVDRLEKLLGIEPPQEWHRTGSRVIAHDFGPLGAINSVIVDKGKFQGISSNLPVITHTGVMGRTFRTGLNFSSVLLLSDPNSRIAVISSETRVKGMLAGQGYQKPLSLLYVHLNSPLQKGETLVTSGLAGIYPKGLPVARVKNILRSDISLFLIVEAIPLVDFRNMEEVLILNSRDKIKTDITGFGD